MPECRSTGCLLLIVYYYEFYETGSITITFLINVWSSVRRTYKSIQTHTRTLTQRFRHTDPHTHKDTQVRDKHTQTHTYIEKDTDKQTQTYTQKHRKTHQGRGKIYKYIMIDKQYLLNFKECSVTNCYYYYF